MRSILILFLCVLSTLVLQAQITSVEGKDAIIMRQKATCGTVDEGVPYYNMWEGRCYSRVPGEKDRVLFNVIGLNTRQCKVVEDDTRGYGFRSVSREIMIYLDPETNEILDEWENPWTGQKVEVVHVANDPVNMRGIAYEKNAEGVSTAKTAYRSYGDIAVTSGEVPLYYANPLGSEYQAYVGGAYHAMEIFNSYYQAKEFTDPSVTRITQSNISWSRIAQWLPWMQMGDKPGLMVFNSTGHSTFDKDKVWERVQEIVKDRYPIYLTPPPLDDTRPNETSWTVFKKHMEGKAKTKVSGRH